LCGVLADATLPTLPFPPHAPGPFAGAPRLPSVLRRGAAEAPMSTPPAPAPASPKPALNWADDVSDDDDVTGGKAKGEEGARGGGGGASAGGR